MHQSLKVASIAAVAAALVAGAGIASSQAAPQSNGSDGPVYFFNSGNGDVLDGDATFIHEEDSPIIAAGHPTDYNVRFDCSPGTTGALAFLTEPGSERAGRNGWTAYNITPQLIQQHINLPNLQLDRFGGGIGWHAVKAAGGTYSLGVACTYDNEVNVLDAWYRTIVVEAGTGNWHAVPNGEGSEGGEQTGEIDLNAPVVESLPLEDGDLTLSVPAGASATFTAAALNGQNQSVTTGTLPSFTVTDERVLSRPGWTLTANVNQFVNASNPTATISNAQLGLVPSVSGDSGAVKGANQAAGSAAYSTVFASAAANTGLGVTTLGGDLTFVAPEGAPAGTYNSKMTLTLVGN